MPWSIRLILMQYLCIPLKIELWHLKLENVEGLMEYYFLLCCTELIHPLGIE